MSLLSRLRDIAGGMRAGDMVCCPHLAHVLLNPIDHSRHILYERGMDHQTERRWRCHVNKY